MALEREKIVFETIHFLQSCEKLEEILVCQALISPVDIRSSSGKLSRNPSTLKSFVFVARNQMEMTAPIVCQFLDVRENSNLTTFWSNLLQLHHCNHLNNLTSVAWTTPETRNQPLPIDVLHPGLQLGHLESYWEPEPILMRSVLDSPTKLKLISCFYDSENFQNFCENHPQLEVLKLDIGTKLSNVGNSKTREVWNGDSWKNLSKLKILSFRAALIENHDMRLPFISSIVQSCPLIEELEIIGQDGCYTYLNVKQLGSIAQLGPSLKRLTLANFRINNGLCLEQILKGCNQLESLRLKNIIGPYYAADPCFYAANLVLALPFAKKLKIFCLFQKNVPQMELLLDSLESCTSISHLSLVCPSSKCFAPWKISKVEFASRLVLLCEKLSQLVALFCYFNVPSEHCDEVSQTLKKRFKIERPAFRADVQSMMKQNGDRANVDGKIQYSYTSREFPVMYNDLLTSCQSQVAFFPYGCKTFLHR